LPLFQPNNAISAPLDCELRSSINDG
jgi:hypothetical protein